MSEAAGAVPSHTLLGVEVQAFDLASLNGHVESAIRAGRKAAIGHHNLHSVYLHGRSARMREFYRQTDSVFIDGMGLVCAGRMLGLPLARENRITYVDWVGPLMALAQDRGWRIFYLGSAPGVVERGADALRARYPSLRIQVRDGYFDADPASAENQAVLDRINEYSPDILMVGMGMPRQEEWILENLKRLDVRVILSSGACMDYLAGVVPTPPRGMARLGFEWFFRLAAEPRRLATRCLWEPWFLLPRFLGELLRNRVLDAGRNGQGPETG